MDKQEKQNLAIKYADQIESFDEQIRTSKNIISIVILRIQRSTTVAQAMKLLATKTG